MEKYKANICFQAEDLIDDLLSFESSSLASDSFKTSDNSLSTTEINIKNEPHFLSDAELHALAKDRQKKDNHNMSKYSNIQVLSRGKPR